MLQHKTILLIEDNPSDIDLTKRALEKVNILNELVVATDGQEALDYLFGTGRIRRPRHFRFTYPHLAGFEISEGVGPGRAADNSDGGVYPPHARGYSHLLPGRTGHGRRL